MFCRKCGTQLADDAIFCHKCATAVVKIEESAVSTPVPNVSVEDNAKYNIVLTDVINRDDLSGNAQMAIAYVLFENRIKAVAGGSEPDDNMKRQVQAESISAAYGIVQNLPATLKMSVRKKEAQFFKERLATYGVTVSLRYCPNCGGALGNMSDRCSVCGYAAIELGDSVSNASVTKVEEPMLGESSSFCRKCGTLSQGEAKFCRKCGNQTGDPPAFASHASAYSFPATQYLEPLKQQTKSVVTHASAAVSGLKNNFTDISKKQYPPASTMIKGLQTQIKSKKMKMIIGASAAALLVLIVIIVASGGRPSGVDRDVWASLQEASKREIPSDPSNNLIGIWQSRDEELTFSPDGTGIKTLRNSNEKYEFTWVRDGSDLTMDGRDFNFQGGVLIIDRSIDSSGGELHLQDFEAWTQVTYHRFRRPSNFLLNDWSGKVTMYNIPDQPMASNVPDLLAFITNGKETTNYDNTNRIGRSYSHSSALSINYLGVGTIDTNDPEIVDRLRGYSDLLRLLGWEFSDSLQDRFGTNAFVKDGVFVAMVVMGDIELMPGLDLSTGGAAIDIGPYPLP